MCINKEMQIIAKANYKISMFYPSPEIFSKKLKLKQNDILVKQEIIFILSLNQRK